MVANDIFEFKEFSVKQSDSMMKIGTDSVLLGTWADSTKAKHILDIGTGTGILALMTAQRNPIATIDAIELDSIAANEARENFNKSPWANRIQVFKCDLADYSPQKKYDYIISNPPYFETGIKAPDLRRAMARHSDSLPYSLFFEKAAKHLNIHGIIGIVAPTEVKDRIEFYAGENNLWIKRRFAVQTSSKKPIKRYLWEYTNYPVELEEGRIVLAEGNERSLEFKNLTKDFYIR